MYLQTIFAVPLSYFSTFLIANLPGGNIYSDHPPYVSFFVKNIPQKSSKSFDNYES